MNADIKKFHDVWMGDGRNRACFTVKTFGQLAPIRIPDRQHFDGHHTIQPRVDRFVDNSHAAAAQTFRDHVGSQLLADRWQTEEYAFLKTGGRQLELVFAEASNSFTVALDYQMPIKTMVPTWNANARRGLAWGPLGRFDWRPGTWFYRIYQPDELRRPCVGFLTEWDQIYEDPHNRPRRVLFGYSCGIPGEALKDEDIRGLIRGIVIRPRDGRSGWRFRTRRAPGGLPALDADAGCLLAIAAAKGQGAPTGSGNPRFPFAFARYYGESGGGKKP